MVWSEAVAENKLVLRGNMSGKLNIILLGPPGAGKGTQAVKISEKYSIPQISTGEILRGAVAAGTKLGKEAKKFMDSGDLVHDEVVVGLVEERLVDDDCKNGYILDGFPRTVEQAKSLDKILDGKGDGINHVISIEVDEAELVKRLTGRRTCRKCGAMYHVVFGPPKAEGECDKCGGELYQRDDDKEETITARLKVYGEKTEPLIEYYSEKGLKRSIPGSGGIEDIFKKIKGVLEE